MTGQTAADFIAEAESNAKQTTPMLSDVAMLRLRKVLDKSKSFKF